MLSRAYVGDGSAVRRGIWNIFLGRSGFFCGSPVGDKGLRPTNPDSEKKHFFSFAFFFNFYKIFSRNFFAAKNAFISRGFPPLRFRSPTLLAISYLCLSMLLSLSSPFLMRGQRAQPSVLGRSTLSSLHRVGPGGTAYHGAIQYSRH